MSPPQRSRFIKWSYSKMKIFETCRERFFRQYVLYEKTPEANNVDFLNGNVLQNLFEHWINYRFYKTRGEAWLLEALPNYYWKHAKSKYKICRLHKDDTHEKHIKSLQRMIPKVYQFFKQYIDQGAELESEIELWYTYQAVNVQLHGKIDFLIKFGDQVVLADLKASKKGSRYIEKTQQVFYNLLLKNLGMDMPTKNVFFTAIDAEVDEFKVTEEEMDALETRLGEYTKIVRGTEYRELNVGNDCYRCPFKPTCWADNKLIPTENRMEF